jgi:hypothetical protein
MKSKLGSLLRVENTKRYNSATAEYVHVHVYENGEVVSLLFTEKELEVAKTRSNNNTEDIPDLLLPQVIIEGVAVKTISHDQGDLTIVVE